MSERRLSGDYEQPEWRYGPLHATGGKIYLGDPLGYCALITPDGIERLGEADPTALAWSEVSELRLELPVTRFRAVSRIADVAAFAVVALSGDAGGADAYDPGALHVTQSDGSAEEWRIDSMETGRYWAKYVALVAVFLEMMRSSGSFREAFGEPATAAHWLQGALND